MKQVNILEETDVIQANDWVRQLTLTFNGQSDHLQTTSTYGGLLINRLGWVPAKVVCPAWVGKTVGKFYSAINKHYPTSSKHPYEFIRGEIPHPHIEPL